MKHLFVALYFVFAGALALATSDGYTEVHLVVAPLQGGSYEVKSFPFVGCYGINYGPQTQIFTEEYKVPSSVGCSTSDPIRYENINALSCASSTFTWNDDFTKVEAAEIDISKCTVDKTELKSFQTSISKALRNNFGMKIIVTVSGSPKKI